MTMTGNEDHSITLTQGAAWTKNFRNTNTPGGIIGHYFGGQALTAILAQTGCVGLRFYYAINDTGQKQLVITGVDANSNDLYQGLLADRSVPCPQICSVANPLNSNTPV